MGMQKIFNDILDNYVKSKKEVLKEHEMARTVTKKLVSEIRDYINNVDMYDVKGSVGNGKWADIPWVGIFDRRFGTNPQQGVYVAYLFSKECNRFYLVLMQGCGDNSKDGNNVEDKSMATVTKNVRNGIDGSYFLKDDKVDLELGEDYTGKALLYESACIFYKEYKKDAVPDDLELKKDLDEMLKIYKEYVEHNPTGRRIEDKVQYELTSGGVNMNNKFDKNMILFGPPGTGKTYSVAKYAVQICCDNATLPDLKDYSAIMRRYRELMKEERVAFVTFHQSYGYEEFIEGIKPVLTEDIENKANNKNGSDVKYEISDGVFKSFCIRAGKPTLNTSSVMQTEFNNASVWKVTVRDEVRQDCFDNNRVRIDWGFNSGGAKGFVEDINKGDIIITTDRSRSNINGIAVVTTEKAVKLEGENDSTSRDVRWLAKGIDVDIKALNQDKWLHRRTVARVPNMNVSKVLEYVKEKYPDNDAVAATTVSPNRKPYLFIIDEINRGNISKIFGELITLIEDTKRAGSDECIPAILPYSKDEFTVPDNVYILGTMNTADRSIALMDTALRRRFKFIEMLPDHSLLDGITVSKDGEGVDVGSMLRIINERISCLYDREHTIGHAIFMSLRNDNSIENLASIFKKSVLPLLQEYFYEDYEKIRLVLGDNAKDKNAQFVVAEDIPSDTFEKTGAGDIDIPEVSYSINNDSFDNIMAYKGISKKL